MHRRTTGRTEAALPQRRFCTTSSAAGCSMRNWRFLPGYFPAPINHGAIDVKTRNLGKSGLQVSLVGLGCNNFGGRIDLEASRKVVHKALDVGITLLDTADIYGDRGGSERVLGEILGDRRKDIVLATKFGMPMDE